MKKTLAIFLSLIFLLCAGTVFAEDYSSYSDSDLYAVIDAARAELQNRKIATDEKPVIMEADGVTVTMSGTPTCEESYSGGKKLIVKIVAVNSGAKDISFMLDEFYVNGWKVSCLESGTVGAGKKAKLEMTFYDVDEMAELSTIEQLEDLEFHWYTYNPETYKTITDNIVSRISF